MKKSFKIMMSLFFAFMMSITLVGCSLTSKKDKSTIEVDNYVEKYYVNQHFLIGGTKLVVKNSKDKILEEIVVTKDMIKEMPDMTSAGEKDIIVLYDGKEYSYKIIVEDRPVDELVTKLSEFLAQYENKNDYTMETSYEMNLVANYFGDEVNVDDSQVMVLFGQLFAGDDLANEAYSALFNSIINGSFDLNSENVMDSNNFKTKLDLLTILEKVKNELEEFDYKTYAFEKVFGKDDLKNIENVSQQISTMFVIKNALGKSSVKTIVSKYYYKLKAFEEFDVTEAIKEILNKVKIYTDSPYIKQMLDVVDTIQNEDLIHFSSSVMEDYWTNYAKVMTIEEYQKDYWEYDYEPTFVNSANSRSLLNKFIKAQKDVIYSIEETLVDLTKVTSLEGFKTEAVDILTSLEKYVSSLGETTQIQKNNSWLIVVDEGYGYTDAIIGGYYAYDYDEQIFAYEPEYDEIINSYNEMENKFSSLCNYIENYSVVEFVKEQQLVENFVEIYFEYFTENEKEALIDSIYGVLENEVSLKESYVAILDALLTDEDNFYVDVLSEYFSYFFAIEDSVGKQQINELVEDLFSYVVNAESFDGVQLYRDLIECVNTYTSNQQVKNLTDLLVELTYDDLIHFGSDLYRKHFESFMNVMTVEEYEKDFWEDDYEPAYVTSQEALDLLEDTISAHTDFVYGIEEYVVSLADVKSFAEFRGETKIFLIDLLEYTAKMEEILEIQKDNNWVITLEDGYGYNDAMVSGKYSAYYEGDEWKYYYKPDYDFDIEHYRYCGSMVEKVYNYIEGYTILEIIEENELVELLVEKNMKDYTDSEKEKIIELIYKILNREVTKEEIKETLKEVFVTNKNIVIEQLIEYLELYANEGSASLFDLLVSQYKNEIIDALVSFSGNLIANEALLEEVQSLIEDVVKGYVNGTLNSEDVINCIKDILKTYSSEHAKVTFSLATIMYHVFNYDENIDYNELFEDYVELPDQIENIDYNELMRKLVNESTYDTFKISDIEIEYVVDEQDNIIGELLTVKMDVDFDVLMISLKGDLKLNVKLDFTNEGN